MATALPRRVAGRLRAEADAFLVRRWLATRARQAGPNAQLATEADIAACYRLLLQREPDPVGMANHVRLFAGKRPVGEVVREFLESAEFQGGQLARAVFYYDQDPTLYELSGFKLYGWPDDTDIGRAFARDSYEPHLTRSLRNELRPGMTVADVGANVGYYSMLTASIVGPEGKVLAFEASRSNCDLLRASAEANGLDNVEIHHAAVWNEPGVLELRRARGSNGSVTPASDTPAPDASGRVQRTVAVRLDDALAGLDRLDVIKIDVEGAEHRAMLGGARTIERLRPTVFTEFAPEAIENVSQVDGPTYLRWFVERGYSISVLEEQEDRFLGQDIDAVMAAYDGAKGNHVDLKLVAG